VAGELTQSDPSEQQSGINFMTFPPVKLAFRGQLAASELSGGGTFSGFEAAVIFVIQITFRFCC
jgi:hypothetical protein